MDAVAASADVRDAVAAASALISSQPVRAARRARALLHQHPNLIDARLVLARALRAQGSAADALAVLEPLVNAGKPVALAVLIRGLVQIDMGDRNAAIESLRRAAALNAALPGVWLALAEQLAAAGDNEGSSDAYGEHVRVSANAPHIRDALQAMHDQNLERAERIIRRHLAGWPNDIAAMALLGEVLGRASADKEACAFFERALDRYPGFAVARKNYATVLHYSQRLPEALAQLDLLIESDPGNTGYKIQQADNLALIGDFENAIATYESVADACASQVRYWIGFGNTLKSAGRHDDAIKAYRAAIALQPGFGEAWWSIANMKTVRFSSDDVAAMEAALAGSTDESDRTMLHFALGKAYEDLTNFETSFTHYRDGNALKRKRVHYDPDDIEAHAAELKQTFTQEFFARRAGAGCQDPAPIFVVGLPRSGSTLVEQILASHSQVEGTMELVHVTELAQNLGATTRKSCAAQVGKLAPGDLSRLGETYLAKAKVQRRLGRPFFIDKMPNNFLHTGLIHLMLPDAKIVDVRREPMACGFSVFKQFFPNGQRFSFDLAEIARYYRCYVDLMAHFDQVLPGRVHRVSYECLVADPENEVRALLDYCQLPFEDACLRFYNNDRGVRTASSEQVRQPLFKDGVEQWRNFEPWLGDLSTGLTIQS